MVYDYDGQKIPERVREDPPGIAPGGFFLRACAIRNRGGVEEVVRVFPLDIAPWEQWNLRNHASF